MSVQQKDPNVSQDSQIGKDVKNSLINESAVLDQSRRYKLQKRILQDGKWVQVTEEPIEDQIKRHNEELQQGDEVVRKLRAQREKLDVQVKEVCGLVQEKVKDSKHDELKKIKKTMDNISHPNRRQYEQYPQKLTPEGVIDRMKELGQEFSNAKKQEEMLTKELESAREENEDKKVLDQIVSFEENIKKIDQEFIKTSADIKKMEKTQKKNDKDIESIQSDRDDAQKINRLTQEVQQQKQKIITITEKRAKEDEQYQVYEKLIAEMNTKYMENCEKAKIQPIQLQQKYREITVDAEWDKLKTKKKSETKDSKEGREEDLEKKAMDLKKKQQVKDIRKDQDNFDSIPINLVNYIRLEQNYTKLQEYKKHQKKLFNKEIKILEEHQSEIQFEISSIQQNIREKEKEKDLANSRFVDLKKLVKHNELESIQPLQKSILEKKKDELKKREAYLLQNRKTEPKNPFSERNYKFQKKTSQKKIDVSIPEEPTPLDMILDCNFRFSNRQLFGVQPDKDTQICDDVNVVGALSIEHRIRKIVFYHNIEKGLIYGFQSEYIRQDKKSTVAGQWQINEEQKKSIGSTQEILDIDSDDWITEMNGEINDGFINYMQINTKRGKILKLGAKQGKSNEFSFKRSKGEIPITIFGGFNAMSQESDDKEKPLALSCFGVECAQKMNIEEKVIVEDENKQKKDKRIKDTNEKQLRENITLQPHIEVEQPKHEEVPKSVEKPKQVEAPKQVDKTKQVDGSKKNIDIPKQSEKTKDVDKSKDKIIK